MHGDNSDRTRVSISVSDSQSSTLMNESQRLLDPFFRPVPTQTITGPCVVCNGFFVLFLDIFLWSVMYFLPSRPPCFGSPCCFS
jgi:hypothetical protein